MRRLVTRWLPAILGVPVLAFSVVEYSRAGELEHFAWHFVYGGTFGLIVSSAATLWAGRQLVRTSLAWLAGYVFMAVPDILWIAPTYVGSAHHRHEPWMDMFLGHVSLDGWSFAWHALPVVVAIGIGAHAWAMRKVGESHATKEATQA